MQQKQLLIDDFSSPVSSHGTRWEGFTDRVMGGVSDMDSRIVREDGLPHLSMSGKVSLERNGGFIQMRLPLGQNGRSTFDGSGFTGLRVIARGAGDGYYIFLRASSNMFPWSFYMAKLPVGETWTEVFVPWTAFGKGDFGALLDLNTRRLTSLAVVAYKKAFDAKLDVREISFY